MISLFKKARNFTVSYIRWALAGKPLRSDEYIFDLYDNFCSQCPTKKFIEISKGIGECDECGCHVKRVPSEEDDFNKLAWPTEGCPDGHWPSDIEEDIDEDTNGQTKPSDKKGV